MNNSIGRQQMSQNMERSYQDSQFVGLQFCEAEFVQAGLLPDTASLSHPAAVLQTAKDPSGSSHTPSGSLPSDLDTSPSGQLEQGPTQPGVPSPSDHERLRLQPDVPRPDTASPQNDKKQANRDHQRRFRERRKARLQTLESQLAKTTQELHSMKLYQQELKNRIQQSEVQAAARNQSASHEAKVAQLDREFVAGYPLNLSLPGRAGQLSTADLASMPTDQFLSLWTEYVQALQKHLTEAETQRDQASEKKLSELVFEACRIRGRRLFAGTPKQTRNQASVQDKAQVTAAQVVARLNLSDSQVEDLLFLRRVYLLEHRELSRQKAALIADLEQDDSNPITEATLLTSIGSRLRNNAAEAYELLYKYSWCIYYGILTVEQHAQMLIHCGPLTPLAEDLVHCLAQQRGLPSKQELLADPNECLSKRDAIRFWQYTEAVNPYVRLRNEYVPIPAPSIIQLY